VLEAAVLKLQLAAAEGVPRLVEVRHSSRMALRQVRSVWKKMRMQSVAISKTIVSAIARIGMALHSHAIHLLLSWCQLMAAPAVQLTSPVNSMHSP
jgi:hypothetical protein